MEVWVEAEKKAKNFAVTPFYSRVQKGKTLTGKIWNPDCMLPLNKGCTNVDICEGEFAP